MWPVEYLGWPGNARRYENHIHVIIIGNLEEKIGKGALEKFFEFDNNTLELSDESAQDALNH